MQYFLFWLASLMLVPVHGFWNWILQSPGDRSFHRALNDPGSGNDVIYNCPPPITEYTTNYTEQAKTYTDPVVESRWFHLAPCALMDTVHSNLASDQVEFTAALIMSFLQMDNAHGYSGLRVADAELNALNSGKGLKVGYNEDVYVKFRILMIVTFPVDQDKIHGPGGIPVWEHTSNLSQWILSSESPYNVDMLVDDPGGSIAKNTAIPIQQRLTKNYQRIMVSRNAGDSMWFAADGTKFENKFLYGTFSSNSYSVQTIVRSFALDGAKTYSSSHPEAWFVSDQWLGKIDEICSATGLVKAAELRTYPMETRTNVTYHYEFALTNCVGDAMFILPRWHEIISWQRAWWDIKCRPKGIWLACLNYNCPLQNKTYYTTSNYWSPALKYYDDFFPSAQAYYDAQTQYPSGPIGKSNTWGFTAYTAVYLFMKGVQAGLRDVDLHNPQELLNFTHAESPADGFDILYEKIRRSLQTLFVRHTIIGPVQFMNERNNAHEHVGLQFMNDYATDTIDKFIVYPTQAAAVASVYPSPASRACVENQALQFNYSIWSFLDNQCRDCPYGQKPDSNNENCIEDPGAFYSCEITGCGKFSVCIPGNPVCQCTNGDTAPAVDFATTRNCEQRVASTDEQRVFWTLQLITYCVSLQCAALTVYEFVHNPALQNPVMRSTLAVSIPDFVLSLVYFCFQFANLLRGKEGADCLIVGFLTYGTVVATVSGPPIVAFVTFRSIISHGVSTSSKSMYKLIMFALPCPWILGIAFAAGAYSANLLGSYRGLYCLATTWQSFYSGVLIFVLFFMGAAITSIIYTIMFLKIKELTSTTTKSTATKTKKVPAHITIAIRGAKLVGAFFCTWSMWSTVGLVNYMGSAPSIDVELVSAILISFQPCLDAYIFLTSKAVAAERAKRFASKCGVTASSTQGEKKSSASSSSASSISSSSVSSSTAMSSSSVSA